MERGVDLVDFVRGRHSWSKFHRVVQHLPWDSAFKRALADDPEYLDGLPDDAEERPTTMRDWDRTREQTALLHDLLEALRGAVLAPYMKAGSKPKMRIYPRPVSVRDQVMEKRARATAASIADQLRPRPAGGEG